MRIQSEVPISMILSGSIPMLSLIITLLDKDSIIIISRGIERSRPSRDSMLCLRTQYLLAILHRVLMIYRIRNRLMNLCRITNEQRNSV